MSVITPEPRLMAAARWRRLRIGLLGGSFNPPHAGHLHIARRALIEFRLNAVWWLVTPGNPLKGNPRGDLDRRMGLVRDFIAGQPKMAAAALEAEMGTRYTWDTVRGLLKHFPQTKFLWIAGMDTAATFDQWQHWQELPQLIPFVFYDRPPGSSKLKAEKLRKNNILKQFPDVIDLEPGLHWSPGGAAVDVSSTAIRQKGRK